MALFMLHALRLADSVLRSGITIARFLLLWRSVLRYC